MLKVRTYIKEVDKKGIGLFADEVIPKNTKIWEYTFQGDSTYHARDISTMKEGLHLDFIHKYGFLERDHWIICMDNARFMNHDASPNTYDNEKGTFAKQDIQPGEEITCNYYEICEFVKEHGLGF